MKCFVDLDGVLANFVGGAAAWHGLPNPYEINPHAEAYDCWDLMGLTEDEFWAPLGEEFWVNLEPLPDAGEILYHAENRFGRENVCFLTSPCKAHSRCASGKVQWIQKHYPEYARRFLIGPPKYFCAHENAVLIDDYDVNCQKFADHGGHAVLVPRPWNALRRIKDAQAHVDAELIAIVDKVSRQCD